MAKAQEHKSNLKFHIQMQTSNSRAVLEYKQDFISPPSPLLAENQIQTPHRSNSPNPWMHVS
jgi:hypothetical protein